MLKNPICLQSHCLYFSWNPLGLFHRFDWFQLPLIHMYWLTSAVFNHSTVSLLCAVLHSPLTTHGLCQPPRRPGPYLVKAPVVGLSSKSRLCTTTAPKMWLTPSKLHFLDSPSFIAFPWWNLVNLKAEINSTHQIIQRYQLKIANPNGCWRVMGVLPHYINPIVSILYAFSNFSVTLPDRFNRSTS